MRIGRLVCAAVVAASIPAAAMADDPKDPTMRSAAARARDHETIRQMNLQELARVQHRDARYAEGWRAWRAGKSDSRGTSNYAAQSHEYERNMAAYSNARAQYERQMARWHERVEACNAGDYSACGK
jgi:hypothetical protein